MPQALVQLSVVSNKQHQQGMHAGNYTYDPMLPYLPDLARAKSACSLPKSDSSLMKPYMRWNEEKQLEIKGHG